MECKVINLAYLGYTNNEAPRSLSVKYNSLSIHIRMVILRD